MKNTIDEAYELFEDMVANNYQWPNERIMPRQGSRVHEIDAIANFLAKQQLFHCSCRTTI